jgi:hypothetical protein
VDRHGHHGCAAYGCPIQAMVHADRGSLSRTRAGFRDRAGQHGKLLHQAIVEAGTLDLVHVQADSLRVKGRKQIMWMARALMVGTRLWRA